MVDVFKYCQEIRRYAVGLAAVFEYLYSTKDIIVSSRYLGLIEDL